MTTPAYPLALDLGGRRAVVVGGGPVAARRAAGLAAAGAVVEVFAPWASEDLREQAAAGAVVWHEREYLVGDLVHPAVTDALRRRFQTMVGACRGGQDLVCPRR